MAKLSSDSIWALVLSGIAFIFSCINFSINFFWVFAILGTIFGVKAILGKEKLYGWISVGLCVLSIAVYSILRVYSFSGNGDNSEVETEQEHREYQRAIENAVQYDITEDSSEPIVAEPQKSSSEIVESPASEAEEEVESAATESEIEPVTHEEKEPESPMFE